MNCLVMLFDFVFAFDIRRSHLESRKQFTHHEPRKPDYRSYFNKTRKATVTIAYGLQ